MSSMTAPSEWKNAAGSTCQLLMSISRQAQILARHVNFVNLYQQFEILRGDWVAQRIKCLRARLTRFKYRLAA